LLVLAAGFAAYTGVFLVYALLPRGGPADLAVVFGSRVLADGTPSARLKARLDAGLTAYRLGLVPLILVSGGREPGGFDEADVMRAYLLQAGIPDNAILLDHDGVNTMATARNAVRIMQARHLRRVLVVTQYFHIPRAMLALRKAGAPGISATYPRFFEWRDFYSILRELAALPDYALRQ
jgi:vancomycin permeability regulator SanA